MKSYRGCGPLQNLYHLDYIRLVALYSASSNLDESRKCSNAEFLKISRMFNWIGAILNTI